MKSIIQGNYDECYICHLQVKLEEHHAFGNNANRKLSEKYGLKFRLCSTHHNESPFGVHYDKGLMERLHIVAQMEFEEKYSRAEFVKIFGKNYI